MAQGCILICFRSTIQFGSEVGRGAYGSVYKGTWNGRVVALKQFPVPEDIDQVDIVNHNKEIAALRYVRPHFTYKAISKVLSNFVCGDLNEKLFVRSQKRSKLVLHCMLQVQLNLCIAATQS